CKADPLLPNCRVEWAEYETVLPFGVWTDDGTTQIGGLILFRLQCDGEAMGGSLKGTFDGSIRSFALASSADYRLRRRHRASGSTSRRRTPPARRRSLRFGPDRDLQGPACQGAAFAPRPRADT